MKNNRIIGYAVLGVLSMSSCSDFLTPDDKATNNNNGNAYIEQNPEVLQATTYNAFSGFATNIAMHDQGADLYINPRSGDDGEFSKYTFTTENGTIQNYYTDAYKAINYANAMIKFNGEDSHLGWEAQFLRAYGYYLLSQQFGAVPYVTNYIMDANRDYPRVSLNEIYESQIAILEDLYNKSGLDDTNHKGIVSKQAVAALLTQYYLAAGWDLDTSLVDDVKGTYNVNSTANFEKAAAWAEKAINGVQLTMSFADKWNPRNEGNQEEIFSFQYLRNSSISRGHSLQNDYIAYWGDCKNTGMKGTGSGGTNMPSDKSRYLFEKGDQRWYATFMDTYYNAKAEIKDGIKATNWGTEGYYAYWNCSPEQLASQPIAYKYYPWYVTEAEAEADLKSLSSQTKKFAADEYGINKPQAAILVEGSVPVYNFNADGTFTKEYQRAEVFYAKADGNGACVKKWDDPESAQVTSGACYRDIPIYHVSDMYLYAAEAYLLAGQTQKALDKINAVRKRAGLKNLASFSDYDPQYTIPSTFVTTPLDLVLDERARELYAERTRWFDLRRTKQLVKYNIAFSRSINSRDDMANRQGEVKWYRPIPEKEIRNNLSLTNEDQNPGY